MIKHGKNVRSIDSKNISKSYKDMFSKAINDSISYKDLIHASIHNYDTIWPDECLSYH